jgi:hypothetical protein
MQRYCQRFDKEYKIKSFNVITVCSDITASIAKNVIRQKHKGKKKLKSYRLPTIWIQASSDLGVDTR